MTLGEKIKLARENAGLTQSQMADKLMVSRPAITMWERDKRIPDVENLKAISELLDVSIDYLLYSSNEMTVNVTKEIIDLASMGKGSKKKKKDNIVKEKFSDAEIYYLSVKKVETKKEKILDNVIGFFTDAPFGIPELINDFKLMDRTFYLIFEEDKQYLVTVSDEFMEVTRLGGIADRKRGSKFTLGEIIYMNCGLMK